VRIGLASDSDGDVDALARALDVLARAGVDRVFFLGRRLADLDAALALRAAAGPDPLAGRVVRVASRADPERAAGAPAKVIDLLDGLLCCAVHDKAELTRDDIENATVLLHGRAHRAALVAIGPRCFVAPGRVRAAAAEGGAEAEPPTCAVLEIGPGGFALAVLGLDGAELRREQVAASASGGRLSVR
jgi:predicted phosphodiesterase